jgi:hypothetical protein
MPQMLTEKKSDPKPEYIDEGVAFTEDFRRSREMIFTATSLQAWIDTVMLMLFPELNGTPEKLLKLHDGTTEMQLAIRRFDPWVFKHNDYGIMCPVPIGRARWMRNWQHCGHGQQWTTDRPVSIPTLTGMFYNDREVWMSLTPMEIATLRGCHRRCKGKVLIGGLGMGFSALRVLQRKNVSHVTVVESFKPLIDLIGPHLKRHFGNSVTLVHGNVWEHLHVNNKRSSANLHDYDSVFIDVWKGYGGNKNNYSFVCVENEAKRLGRVATAWG